MFVYFDPVGLGSGPHVLGNEKVEYIKYKYGVKKVNIYTVLYCENINIEL